MRLIKCWWGKNRGNARERGGLGAPRGPRVPRAQAHTQARVELAGVAVLLPQVRAVRVQLPRVAKVLHQGLHQARGRAEVVALVAVEVPAQAARPPRVDGGQLERQAALEQLPQQPQPPFAREVALIANAPLPG